MNSKDIGLPQILEDSAIKALREQRAVLMADYQNKLSTFKPAYPDMLRLKAQIDQISAEIKSAADVIKQSLKARYEAALQQEVLLKKKMDETKRGVLDTRNKEIQFNILKREADTNRTLYDGLLQQYKDAGVAGAVGTNNVAVIDRAQLPGGPFKPNLRKNLLMWLMLGLVAAAACNRAIRNPRRYLQVARRDRRTTRVGGIGRHSVCGRGCSCGYHRTIKPLGRGLSFLSHRSSVLH